MRCNEYWFAGETNMGLNLALNHILIIFFTVLLITNARQINVISHIEHTIGRNNYIYERFHIASLLFCKRLYLISVYLFTCLLILYIYLLLFLVYGIVWALWRFIVCWPIRESLIRVGYWEFQYFKIRIKKRRFNLHN